MKTFIKKMSGMALAMAMAFSSITSVTALAANPGLADVSKAEFVTGVQAVDADDFTEMVFSVYLYNDQYYAFIKKGDKDGYFAQVEVAEADFDNMTNCHKYKIDGSDYVVGLGELKDGTPVLMDNDDYIGSGRQITAKESLSAVNAK